MRANIHAGIIFVCTMVFTVSCNSDPGPKERGIHYPVFSNEEEVTITGYAGDAMEPFITADNAFLFFNSLNDAVDTSLFYATRQSDTQFTLAGEIGGVNGEPPHLDAVASMDLAGGFYFVSTRDYPAVFENYKRGTFANGAVTGIAPVQGDIYVYSPGWLIMDAEVSRNGDTLYYVNARFSGQPMPEETRICTGVKSGSSFGTHARSSFILENVNDPDYLAYAPAASSDGTELYFTRLKKGSAETEICVSVRASTDGKFSLPKKIDIQGYLPEGPTITADGTRLYYHKKTEQNGKYRIFSMSRE